MQARHRARAVITARGMLPIAGQSWAKCHASRTPDGDSAWRVYFRIGKSCSLRAILLVNSSRVIKLLSWIGEDHGPTCSISYRVLRMPPF